jgi:hypothetical protein
MVLGETKKKRDERGRRYESELGQGVGGQGRG